MPKWWLLHLAVLAAVLVMLRLGLWQWDRANSASGGIQNYAYAFQWPLFAVFGIVLWARTLHEELHRDPATEAAKVRAALAAPDSEVTRHEGLVIGLRSNSAATSEDGADDTELAAWNARLTALNAATAAIESRRR
jgi:DNA-binding transcriptional regulator of glucitol operon